MSFVFLSYSRKDTDMMHRVRNALQMENLVIWTDEGIEPGTASWKQAIEVAIIGSSCMVCILSPDAFNSRWVRKEIEFAELHEKPIFPILAKGNDQEITPFSLASVQSIDIRNENQFDEKMQLLVNTISTRVINTHILRLKNLKLDTQSYQFYINGEIVQLTSTECRLLSYFMRHPDQYLTPSKLLEDVWEYETGEGDPDLVRAHIRNLRARLKFKAEKELITNIDLSSYKFSV